MRKATLLILVAISVVPSLYGEDFPSVRLNMLDYYAAAGADSSAPRMQQALAALESVTRDITAPGFLLADGSWSDVNYSETPSGAWSPWEHFRRMTVMAKAYRTAGQPYYRNQVLRTQIESALRRARDIYGPATLPLGNWWFWTLGVPLDLGPTLVMMQGDVDPSLLADLTQAIAIKIGSSPTARGIVGPIPTGQNLVWSSFAHLCVAVLRDDVVRLAKVRDAMALVTLPSAVADGIKPDWSFHQHGAQLYTGGYGGSFAYDVARYALITRNTSYALPGASHESFASYLADGVSWSLYGNYFDISVVGREVAKPTTSGFNGFAGLLQASLVPSTRNGEIRAAASRMLQTWTWTLPTELAALTSQLGASFAAWPSGYRHYFASDFSIHRRPNWYASVKMLSMRTKSGESTNSENMLGARQSDGRMYLVLAGDDYYERNVLPALDWARLPGTTVELRPDAANNAYGIGSRWFAGGTGNGRTGVSAMELAPVNSTLTAKKSWFFFDDAIVFLTNSITTPGLYPVETIVNQWPLRSATSAVTTSGGATPEWIVADRIGYWFPTPGQKVKATRETRSGSWSQLAASSTGESGAVPVLTIAVDHGTLPVNASAEYVIVPDTTPEALRQFSSARPIQVLANSNSVSAARDLRTNTLGVVFWSAAVFQGIQSDSALLLQAIDDGKALRLSLSDPTGASTGVVRLTIPGRFTSADVRLFSSGTSTTIEIPRNGGRTIQATLTRATMNRRRVGR